MELAIIGVCVRIMRQGLSNDPILLVPRPVELLF